MVGEMASFFEATETVMDSFHSDEAEKQMEGHGFYHAEEEEHEKVC